ncbi:Fe-S cluster assembly protein SufD [Frankia sp. CNm7]|uniref:Fe-S cluster assembly protein SufD n=1 Tax=Frankia nepalensis TaxID=1836974 RepID=A0A937RN66_9ACTN|nr:Fe-S cluster assembly protein SufD [Frankia nepalensis]MBL7494842.1 Fe-S cluster assembly protein SufD [Frankia nepalensis]MBL7514082.1 Fe-S cluster assembly protein SufD [Frankia nepalensis]MBL7518737.1 Fe-S cluster assembly protein SufD [Frankia nepalensis]MBL7633552.1 Fe-S cluster assembly protein SufD [Frankia nepalensis]
MAVIDATGRPPAAAAPAAPVRSRDPEAHPVPTGREEAWRFTPLRPLKPLIAGQEPDGKIDISVAAPEGVEVEFVDADDPRVGRVLTPVDRVAAFATVRAGGAVAVTVPGETELTEPIVAALRGEGGVCYSHLVVEVGPFARATVVLDHTGTAKYAGNVEVHVGHGASVTFVSLQDWDDDAVHAGAHAFSVGRDAKLRATHLTLGGHLVRINPTVDYRGPGGDAELAGLFFTDAGQHQEHRLLVTHLERNCRSRVTYKGALQGADAHSVWIGDVLIGADAVGTDTYEINRNLVLTDGARADSVPNLEILTGEVAGAGHASATGRFDDEVLFYLMARGIPAGEARRLVVRGFFGEVLDRIDVPALRDRVMAAVDAELSAVGA